MRMSAMVETMAHAFLMLVIIATVIGTYLLTALATVYGQPPAGPIDPAVHAWFDGLVRADGASCCKSSDCRFAQPGEVRVSADGFEVKLNKGWVRVPDALLVHREDNPRGLTVVCKSHPETLNEPETLYCLVPYSGG